LRTYLIEPQLIFVPFLTRLLSDAGLEIVASRRDFDAKDIASHDPALVFVDVDFCERGAANALCRIQQVAKDAAVIVYTDGEDADFEAACYISGASAIVSKRAGIDALIKTVRGLLPSRAEAAGDTQAAELLVG